MSLINPDTKRMKVRLVDTESESYKVAKKFMVTLNKEDFMDAHELAKYAATCGISINEFRKRFEYTVENDEKIWDMKDLNQRSEEHVKKWGTNRPESTLEEETPESKKDSEEKEKKKNQSEIKQAFKESKKNNKKNDDKDKKKN
jgi:hypothetical protein